MEIIGSSPSADRQEWPSGAAIGEDWCGATQRLSVTPARGVTWEVPPSACAVTPTGRPQIRPKGFLGIWVAQPPPGQSSLRILVG